MTDLLYVGIGVAFFLVSFLLIWFFNLFLGEP